MSNLGAVSVIIPVLNEENTILGSMESLINGDYPVDKLEFIFVDGGSSDRTLKEIEHFCTGHSNLKTKVLKNPYRTQGYGLNIGLENMDSQSEIVIRADAHSIYPRNYIKNCTQTISTVNVDNVGGVMFPEGKTSFQRATAFCMSHWAGVGNAKFHLGNYSGFVDTVYLGCFRKDIFEKVGLFDPLMTPNEDAEFNIRILRYGGRIYLNGDLKVKYTPRGSVVELMKQYFRYGQGRCRTFKKHRKFTSIRQIIPPLWVILTIILIGMGFISKSYLVPLTAYLLALLVVAVGGVFKKRDVSLLLSPICFVIMHYAWGLGFLIEVARKKPTK